MKIRKIALLLLAMITGTLFTFAQKVELSNGDLEILKGETSINIEFTYNKMAVGEFSKESEYVKKKTEEYNKKEAGTGDSWAAQWIADRQARYEPKFVELFTKYSGLTFSPTAKYTLVFNTSFTEPGYQIAIKKKPAEIEGTATIVETENKTKKVATMTVEKGGSGYFKGAAFDSGSRIAEAYAGAAKKLGTLVKKLAK